MDNYYSTIFRVFTEIQNFFSKALDIRQTQQLRKVNLTVYSMFKNTENSRRQSSKVIISTCQSELLRAFLLCWTLTLDAKLRNVSTIECKKCSENMFSCLDYVKSFTGNLLVLRSKEQVCASTTVKKRVNLNYWTSQIEQIWIRIGS